MSIGIKSWDDFIGRDVVAPTRLVEDKSSSGGEFKLKKSELMQKVFFSKMKDKPFAKKRHCRVR